MKLIDSHCHLDFPIFANDREAVLQQAQQAHVSNIIIPAVVSKTWPTLSALCQIPQIVSLHPAFGLHPMFMSQHHPDDLLQLEQWLALPQTVAVGECGLDFFVQKDNQTTQLSYFHEQLDLAVQYDLPVIIHSRKSLDLVLKALRQRPSLKGVVHSFSGSLQQARQLIDLGFYLGFGGPVTYTRATKLRHLIEQLPLSAMVLETDAPDQPDANHHGLRNQPAWLQDIAQVVATLKGMTLREVAMITTRNSCDLFAIKNALL